MNIYDKYKVDEETFRWICIATVWKVRYSDEGIEQARSEIAQRGIDLEQFDDAFFIDVLSSDYKGWERLIRRMFNELKGVGWTHVIPVHYKEKYGELQLSIASDNQQMHEIVDRYLPQINQSCMECGDHGERVSIMGWDSIYCLTHYINYCPKIEKINEFGFTVNAERYYWSDIKSLNGYPSFRDESPIDNYDDLMERIDIELKNDSIYQGRDFNFVSLHDEYINWYLFLSKVPKSLLDAFLNQYIQNFFQILSDCKICGTRAVHYSRCLYCHTSPWDSISDRSKEKRISQGKSEHDYIKLHQLAFYSSTSFYEKRKLEEFFERKEDHQLLFTNGELLDEKELDAD